jgi:hypothetical protein
MGNVAELVVVMVGLSRVNSYVGRVCGRDNRLVAEIDIFMIV